MKRLKKYLTLAIIADMMKFISSLLIVFATDAPSGLGVTWIGEGNVLLVHPLWLKFGMWLLIIGFGVQLFKEIYQIKRSAFAG